MKKQIAMFSIIASLAAGLAINAQAAWNARQLTKAFGTTNTSAVVTNTADSFKGTIDRLHVTVSGYANPTGSYWVTTADGVVVATNSFTAEGVKDFFPRIPATDTAGTTLAASGTPTNIVVYAGSAVPISTDNGLILYMSRCNDTGVTVTVNVPYSY